MDDSRCDPVGAADIAQRIGVPNNTVHTWSWRGVFLEPKWYVSGNPAWNWPDVRRWLDQWNEEHGTRY